MSDAEDREAIFELINRNRIAIWSQDYAAYESCFAHADYVTRWNASRRHGNFIRQGWNDIADRVRRQFLDKSLYRPDLAYDTTVENLILRIEGDMAWASYDQHYPDAAPGYSSGPYVTHEIRVLERQEGQWRIVFFGFMDEVAGGHDDQPLLRLTSDGTVKWQSASAAAALAEDDNLVIRAGRLRVRDSRTDAKLQAAIRWAADQDRAVMASRGALPIVLEAGEGLPTIVWWVIAESGMILFAFGRSNLSAERLAAAAIVYDLSPAQLQVASHVVAGLSLPDIAEAMAITPNTARTHLNRIFEKTGVRTQTALVRVLLSTVSPL
jgi:DNA-binding CsgD family transcriptional regulator